MIPFFAQVPPVTTIVQPQELVCRRIPSRRAGFVQVGHRIDRITVSAHTKCAWVNKANRTIIRSF